MIALDRRCAVPQLSKFAALAWVFALIVTVSAAKAQQDEPPRPQLPPIVVNGQMADGEIVAALDPWLARLNHDDMFNGALLVARNGREIYARTYGARDVPPGTPLAVDDRFSIASIGKAFTHVAVAQLIQAGKLSPETTIGDVLPSYPNKITRGATVAQLLSHRGGVADFFQEGPDTPKTELTSNHAYYELVSRRPPLFAPGEREEYCNGCYVVLGQMIETITGQSYEQYVAEHVFAPAQMGRSGFLRHDRLPADAARFVGRPQGRLEDVSRFHGVAGSAAGGSYSTVRDLLAFDNALREHRLLDPEQTAQVLRGQPEKGRATARIGFAGGAPGVNTMLAGNGAWTVIVLTNRPPTAGETIGSTVFTRFAGPRPK